MAVNIGIVMPDDLKERLEKEAEKRYTPKSVLARQLIAKGLSKIEEEDKVDG